MRILFAGISGYHYPHTRVRCYNFARELKKYSFQTEVLSFKDHLAPNLSEARMYGVPDRWKLLLNIRALKYLWRFRGQVVYLQKIHYHAAFIFLLARLGFFRLVFDLDDWDEHCLCLFSRPVLNRFFFGSNNYQTIVQRAAKLSIFTVVSSHELLERLRPFQEKTFLVHTGVDSERFHTCHREGRQEILCGWTGLIWGETVFQSVVMMIEAFAIAWQQEPHLRLKVVGGGLLMPRLVKTVTDNYANVPVSFVDWVHPDDMVSILHSFDIGLLPLKATSDEDLTWIKCKSPTKFFEFLATGLPTIASAVGEVQHLIRNGENGFLVTSKSEFSEKILELARDPGLRQKIGDEARTTIEQNYNLVSLGKKLAAVFAHSLPENFHIERT